MAGRDYNPRLTCRPHVWHRWRTHQEREDGGDGGQLRQCLDCGKRGRTQARLGWVLGGSGQTVSPFDPCRAAIDRDAALGLTAVRRPRAHRGSPRSRSSRTRCCPPSRMSWRSF
jgi:hypothetical protein